jgi:hypothetical protein
MSFLKCHLPFIRGGMNFDKILFNFWEKKNKGNLRN